MVRIIILSNITIKAKIYDQLKNNNHNGGGEKKIEKYTILFKLIIH